MCHAPRLSALFIPLTFFIIIIIIFVHQYLPTHLFTCYLLVINVQLPVSTLLSTGGTLSGGIQPRMGGFPPPKAISRRGWVAPRGAVLTAVRSAVLGVHLRAGQRALEEGACMALRTDTR